MEIKAVKTVKSRKPMQTVLNLAVEEDNGRECGLINLRLEIEYQEIYGFGGAFTEASAVTFKKASKENREKIINYYFDEEKGIGYNLGRIHINSCDFALENYTCVDENDDTLESFQIDRDKKYVIPMVKEAKRHSDIKFLASPWSPPAYMKNNGTMNRGGKLKPEYYELWAEYYVKFIEAYKKEGIDIGAVTVQNEAKATQVWDSCVYSAEEEHEFVANYLGKKMRDVGVKILFWDHNKERVIDRAAVMLNDEATRDYASGIAFHWYSGDHFEELEMFHKLYPEKALVFSEGCYEYSLGCADTNKIGEKYAHDMIGNFNNYCNAFIDWNLLLDETGGPNHACNYCDAPIMFDTRSGEIVIHDSYYYIGHFSKYVKRGAKRIGCSKFTKNLETVAFKNPDGSVVSVVMNATEKEISFAFRIRGKIVSATAEPHSIATYVFG